MRPEISSM